jgi:glutamine amidotransferase
MKKKVCILNYGSGNIQSVYNLVRLLGVDVQVSNDQQIIEDATHFLLPGVGAFGPSMEKIKAEIPLDVLEKEVFENTKPFLGICVGMQVLADEGYEFGHFQGLGWISGKVKKLEAEGLTLPHIGWNDLNMKGDLSLFKNWTGEIDFYFVHSYAFQPDHSEHVIATAVYGKEFCCAIRKDNIYGVQFHPEKSQKAGQALIKNFLELS